MQMDKPGMLILAATPIGDAADASPALIRALAGADIVAAEDTRRFRNLAARLGLAITATIVSHFDANEAARAEELVPELLAGKTIVVVTDAGMPAVSDPGFRLVQAAIAAGIRVTAVPGPSAVLTALALSGLPTDRFCFEGFPPRRSGERTRRLQDLVTEQRTMVFFEAPHRLNAFLVDAAAVLGDQRQAAICRELTKTYEEVKRGSLADLAQWAAPGVRGEITIVIAGCGPVTTVADDAVTDVLDRVQAGVSFKDAVAAAAQEHRMSRKALYDQALAARTARKQQRDQVEKHP